MADIRTTGQLDDFSGGFQDPILSPWVKADSASWGANMWRSAGGSLIGKAGDSMYGLSTKNFSGDNVEVWGQTADAADLTEGWRMALLKDIGGTSACDGYAMRYTVGVGDENVTINRMDNGVFTGLANVNVSDAPSPAYFLTRINGDDVEVWRSIVGSTNFLLLASATDTTHRTNLHPCLGISTDDGTGPGWTGMGGGGGRGLTPLPQYIRRTHKRGTLWTP